MNSFMSLYLRRFQGFIIDAIFSDSIIINSDRSAVVQVIGNLVSNGIKYSPRERKIAISVLGLDQYVIIKVKDHGLGFSEKDKKLVFQKYKKLSAQPTGGESSSGIGLFIVKMLIEKMNGIISFESEQRVGTEFTITLPRNYKKPLRFNTDDKSGKEMNH